MRVPREALMEKERIHLPTLAGRRAEEKTHLPALAGRRALDQVVFHLAREGTSELARPQTPRDGAIKV